MVAALPTPSGPEFDPQTGLANLQMSQLSSATTSTDVIGQTDAFRVAIRKIAA
jgi:hypothetical protein